MDEPNAEHPYSLLTPDVILNAIDSIGYRSNGRLLALNSYENRVYQVGLEDEPSPLIAKFYRPERWTDAAILEEHEFTRELAEAELPVATPIEKNATETLFYFEGFRFALYPRFGGYAPDLSHKAERMQLGRLIARIHLIGARVKYKHRPTLSQSEFGEQSVSYLLSQEFLPDHLIPAYQSLARDLLAAIAQRFVLAGPYPAIRLHGDCHAGNVLWRDDRAQFVDFDDSRLGPAVQDLWMLLSGDPNERRVQIEDVLSGYMEFNDFDHRQLHLIEALRTLRMMHYAAWLAKRWQDPAFPAAFPWFNTPRYWEDHVLSLREQLGNLQEYTTEMGD